MNKKVLYLADWNTKYEARNSKQYQNINDINSKLCLSCQIKVYVRVSADTKTWACWLYVLATLWLTTCGSPLYLPFLWRLTFAFWQTYIYINRFPNNSKQKNEKKELFYRRPAGYEQTEGLDLCQGFFCVISVVNITIRIFMLNFWVISAILYIDPWWGYLSGPRLLRTSGFFYILETRWTVIAYMSMASMFIMPSMAHIITNLACHEQIRINVSGTESTNG